MIQVLLHPDALSMVGSMNAFEIYNDSGTDVVFILAYGGTGKTIVQHTYTPNDKNRISINVKDIILPLLSFHLKDTTEVYTQGDIMKNFKATIYAVGSESDKKDVSFSVIRAGVDRLSDSAENFLVGNFLTWQPNVKAVTYYSPEFLTYYAKGGCKVICKAYLWNGGEYEEVEKVLATLEADDVYTIPVQYAIIAKLVGGDILPSYYDIWIADESPTLDRLTYVQRYYADDQRGEEEEWFLFENSLGGVDCFRAYGNSENTAEHTHNVAEIEEDSEEYRVDTARKFKKHTGYLDSKERQWLLDFFPSLGKYHYQNQSIRKITVTESDVNWDAKELPSDYSFTYKYSDARPYLNLTRTDGNFSEMQIHVPDLGNFTIAPRLAEFPRIALSGGALFPMQSPYSEEWGATTLDAIYAHFVAKMSENYTGGGGVGHNHPNIDLLNELTESLGYLLYMGAKMKAGYADEADDFSENSKAASKILRKDKEDTATALLHFLSGAEFGDFISGILSGTGARIDELGNGEFESITSRSAIIAKELIVNRQTAIESNFYTTESGVIESVTEIPATSEGGSTTYELKLQKRWENDFTAFHEQDCIRASINTLMADGKYYDMWLRVLSVNAVTNTITVVMYPDDEVPSKKNYPPVELARLIRWGNPIDETRQRLWYLSAESGTIILLNHVTKPIIDRTNYSIAIGLLPDALSFVFQDFPNADPNDGAIYTKWIAAEQFVYKDYEGNVKQNVVDRGLWLLDTAKGDSPYRCIATEVHDVWHYGCRWRCLKDKTTLEPMYSSQGWAFVEGNPNFEVEMTSTNGWDFNADIISTRDDNGDLPVFTTLGFDAKLYNRGVNGYILDKNVIWTRDTGNPTEDNAWAVKRADAGFTVPITWDDLGINAEERWKCTFKVSVTIIDETASVDTQQARAITSEASFTLSNN